MTITAQTAKSGPYNGNGATTVFSYTFKVADEADLVVTVLSADGGTETVKTLTTDYTVSGVGNAGGGSITMLVAPVTGEKLTITRSVDLDQEVDLQNRGSVNPQTLEDSLDKLTQIAQDQQQQLDRSLKVDLFETADLATLTTNVNAVAAIATEVGTVAGISSDVTTVAGDAADIGTVAGISSEVGTVAGISSDVTAVAADATDIGTVAGSIADVSTVAGISANVTSVAGISANVTTVAGISADVTTVAADGADIGTVAGISLDVTTVAGISSDVTAVAGISSDVTTAATNVADITNFADVYLGPKTSDPATRNDGSALQAGDLYFNTTSDQMFVYDGATWLALSALTLADFGVTATATELNLLDGITALSGSDTEIVTGTAGTDGQIGKWNADGDLIGVGTNTANGDVVVLEDVSGSPGLPAVDGSQLTGISAGATTLTTMDLSVSATYSSIPAGANFLRLRIKGLSLSGTDDPFLRIGDAGGVEATGYVSVNHGFGTGVTRQLETTAWQFNTLSAAARTVSGVVELFRVGATNEWEMKFHGRDNNDRQLFTSGSKTLSAELTTIAFVASGSDTVDAGSVIVEELS